jgi:uncharacterized protein (TIGR02598 family)
MEQRIVIMFLESVIAVQRCLPFRRNAAFSLVEVAVSIGILSFCMVAMLGLLPVALNSSRQSIDRICEIRMLETVRAALLKTPYSHLSGTTEFSFDVDGALLPETEGDGERLHFRIEAIFQSDTLLPAGQTAAKLVTAHVTIRDIVRKEERNWSLHLPDNGY